MKSFLEKRTREENNRNNCDSQKGGETTRLRSDSTSCALIKIPGCWTSLVSQFVPIALEEPRHAEQREKSIVLKYRVIDERVQLSETGMTKARGIAHGKEDGPKGLADRRKHPRTDPEVSRPDIGAHKKARFQGLYYHAHCEDQARNSHSGVCTITTL